MLCMDGECLFPQILCSSEDLLLLQASLPLVVLEELLCELKSVQSELVWKVENLDHSVQSIVEALPQLVILEMEVTVILPL